ncbi:ABC transporter ATP-binding protein [Endomicrobiia bacterium]|nr:ABC transporter ATP-binding protein [Endomicrobiia bacterium]GHT70901.1 ABC transporter ATP-binding protein [Endomicrobiia bacterium]GHT75122.1 ABC transporter ATP-binding protein [Endomicrobiia bacterium]
MILAVIFMGLNALLSSWSIYLLKPIFDEAFIAKNKDILLLIAGQVVVAFGAKGFTEYIQHVTMIKVGANFTRQLQGDLYDKIIVQDLEFYHNNNSGSLLVYFMSDLNTIRDVSINVVTALVQDTCHLISLIVIMFWKSFDMAIVMFLLFPIGFYPIVYFGKKVKSIFRNQQNSFGNLYAILAQSFQGIKIVKSYNMETVESEKVRGSANAIANIEVKLAKNNNILSPLMEFLGGVAAAGTLAYGGYKIMHGSLTTGEFVMFLVAALDAYRPMKNLANLNSRMQMGIIAIDRVFTVMENKPKIVDKPEAKVFKAKKGQIKVKNAKFSYVPNIEILHGINLEVKEGEKVAIVGAAGSGKSTLINLILRFYDVKDGSIKIDGEDIRDITIKSLRDSIAFVSQDVVLFDDTIKKNILMGRPDATDEEAIEAAKNAAAHNFIVNQNQGYDTVVGERGGNLSGGQKQMISIARAMLKNATILLLDEATSSLDSKSERMVQEGLERLMHGRTSIVIAHRLSTIINADKIYVFEFGNIVESGTHKELLALNGYYANLYRLQFMNE